MAPRSDSQQGSSREELVQEIRERARSIRKDALKMVFEARQGHPGGDMSVADILAALYFGVLRVDPREPRAPDRDRLILSKVMQAARSMRLWLKPDSFRSRCFGPL